MRSAHDADYARLRHAAMLYAERAEFALDDRGGTFLFKSELGEAMDVAPDGDRALQNGRIDGSRRHFKVATNNVKCASCAALSAATPAGTSMAPGTLCSPAENCA